jgi:hypothetical protein
MLQVSCMEESEKLPDNQPLKDTDMPSAFSVIDLPSLKSSNCST